MIGCKVFHGTFKEGTIIDQSDTSITVEFPNRSDGGNPVAKFVISSAFAMGHLSPADDLSKTRILAAIEARKCAFCGDNKHSTCKIDGHRMCSACQDTHTTTCSFCGETHLKSSILRVHGVEKAYEMYRLCPECAEKHMYTCSECKTRFLNSQYPPVTLNGKMYCQDCLPDVLVSCDICGEIFDCNDESSITKISGDNAYICHKCVPENTFTCSACDRFLQNKDRAAGKYVSDKAICTACVCGCFACGELLDLDSCIHSFGQFYCPECWDNAIQCPHCGDLFLPNSSKKKKCPDCEASDDYIRRLSKIDFTAYRYKELDYSDLDYLDRSQLFTDLFDGKRYFEDNSRSKPEDLFQILSLSLRGRKLVITTVDSKTLGNVKWSANKSLTEFRTTAGRIAVNSAIDEWLPHSKKIVETPVGKMKILRYPIKLRIQTNYDRTYGKVWNGPYDYLEIGNYGDHHLFYIIGIIK